MSATSGYPNGRDAFQPSDTASASTSSAETRLQLSTTPEIVERRITRTLDPKDALLLAWLAIEGPTPRARLAGLLFPEADEARARNNLRQRLFQLKKKYATSTVQGDTVLQLNPDIWVDVVADSIKYASLLGDWVADDLETINDWLTEQRAVRSAQKALWLTDAAEQAESKGDHVNALEHALSLLSMQPDAEHAHRRVMRLHYVQGNRAAALASYEVCKQALSRYLGGVPSKETEALRVHIETCAPSTSPTALLQDRVPPSVLRPPHLVGRGSQWNALSRIWRNGGAALVVGEAGVGKTRLLSDLSQAYERTLSVTARPGDERVPYAVLTKFIRKLITQVAPQPTIARELARLLPELGEADPIHNEESRARFTNAVDEYLRLSTGHFKAILFEDLHFADTASCEALLRTAQRSSGCAWIVSTRGVELNPAISSLIRTLEDCRSATRVDLQPLTQPHILELLDSLQLEISSDASKTLAQVLYQRAGGNPLYTLEVLKSMFASGVDLCAPGIKAIDLPQPRCLDSVIGARLARLSTAAVNLARCAAIAGQAFSITLAARVLGVRPLDLTDSWNELEAAQVFRDGAFAHDLIFEAARASIPAPIARELHREIAELLSDHAPSATIAEHWRAAHAWGQAGASYIAAAKAARAASRHSEEVAFLDQAIECFTRCEDTAAEFDVLLQLVSALTYVDAGQRQQTALDQLLRSANTPTQRLKALTESCYAEANRGHRIRSMALAREGLSLADSLEDQEAAFKCATAIAVGLVYQNKHQEALDVFESQRSWVQTQGSARDRRDFEADRSLALLGLCQIERAHESLKNALMAARDIGDLADLNAVLALQAATFMRGGAIEQALESNRQAMALHDALGTVAGVPLVDRATRAWLLAHLGQYEESLRLYDQVIEAFDNAGIAPLSQRVRAMRALTYLHLGQTARAQQTLGTHKPDATHSPLEHLVCGLIERASGRGAELSALQHFSAVGAATQTTSTLMSLAEVARVYQIEIMDADAAHRAAKTLAQRTHKRQQIGVAIAAYAQLARCSAARSQRKDVRNAVEHATTLMKQFHPEIVYRGEVWLTLMSALNEIGDHQAANQMAQSATSWIETIAHNHVPKPFKESFLERNPTNFKLRQAAARARRAAATV